MRIDAHMHFWDLARENYAWIKSDLGKVDQNYFPGDLAPLLDANGLDKSIVVEAIGTREETKFLLRLFEENPRIAGVIGGIALDAEGLEKDLAEFRANKGLIGIRMRAGWKNREWDTQPQVKANLKLLEKESIPVDLTADFHDTEAILTLFQSFPNLKTIIDPSGDPAMLHMPEFRKNWKKRLSEVAAAGSIMCKIKPFGLLDMTRKDNRINSAWNAQDLNLFVQDVVEAFGPSRLIFGSNWPVSLVVAEYGEVVAHIRRSLSSCVTHDETEAVFGLNVMRSYGLKD